MRLELLAVALFSGACVVTACADDAPPPATSDLTRSLLTEPIGDGVSTPMGEIQALSQQEPDIPLTEIGYNRGDVDAPVKIIELSDYGCGYCRKFHEETYPTLFTQFVESGMVEWKFMPYITGMFDNSLVASEAAECAYVQSETAFEALNSKLWANQSEWKGSDSPEPVVRGWASEVGIDMAAFDACLAEDSGFERVAGATAIARRLGVRGTPTFILLGGYPPLQGALPLETFQQVLYAVYGEAIAEGGQ
jgi:protein-disulfide isomerase